MQIIVHLEKLNEEQISFLSQVGGKFKLDWQGECDYAEYQDMQAWFDEHQIAIHDVNF